MGEMIMLFLGNAIAGLIIMALFGVYFALTDKDKEGKGK